MSTRNCPILCALFVSGWAQAQSIAPDRVTDWSGPGAGPSFAAPVSVNILSFGADPTGVAACDGALQGAISALAGPGEVLFPAGQYRFVQTIVLPDSIILQGDADAGNMPLAQLLLAPGNGADGILIAGVEQPITAAVIAPPIQGERFIRVDQPGLFALGDILRLNATDDTALVNDWWGVGQTGQIVEVDMVTSDTLWFSKPLRRSYATAPQLRRLAPRRQVHLRCLAIERQDATSLQTVNVMFRNAVDCTMHGVYSHLGNYAHVDVFRSARITIESCHFKDAHAYTSGGNGYGVLVDFGSSDCHVHRNAFEHLRHSMLLQAGANGNVLAYNRSVDPYWVSFPFPSDAAGDLVLHGNYPYMNLFEGNVVQNIVIDNSHDINGPHNTFFRNRAELYGIFMNSAPASNDQNFIGNQVTNTSSVLHGLYSLQGTGHFAHGNQVKGTILPAGTSEPDSASLFGYEFGDFYTVHSAIPPIRTDNWQAVQPLVEAHYRWTQLGQPAACTDPEFLPTGLMERSLDEHLRCHPVPAEAVLWVEGLAPGEPVRVLDALGRCELHTVAGGASMSLQVDGLPPGMHLLCAGAGRCVRFIRR
jgi:hypothetical protein